MNTMAHENKKKKSVLSTETTSLLKQSEQDDDPNNMNNNINNSRSSRRFQSLWRTSLRPQRKTGNNTVNNKTNTMADASSSSSIVSVEGSVLIRFEFLLRIVLLLMLSFFLGTCFPLQHEIAQRVLQYSSVAYVTCLILLLAVQWETASVVDAATERTTQATTTTRTNTRALDDDADRVDLESTAIVAMEEGMPLLMETSRDDSHNNSSDNNDNGLLEPLDHTEASHQRSMSDATLLLPSIVSPPPTPPSMTDAPTKKTNTTVTVKTMKTTGERTFLAHPSLKPLHIIDAMAGPRRANLNNPMHLHVMDTEYFSGHMMILIRTPDVDDHHAASSFSSTTTTTTALYPENITAANYLRGKMRRFEFQFQGKLKKTPTGRTYFACELDQPIKLGMIQRAFVGAAMAFVKSSNPYFHYSITGDASTGEPPHMAFPFVEGMNAIVATPPGQTPPMLGGPIEESLQSQKNRKKGGAPFTWNLDYTYTFALWSAYVDFLQWKCLNLPGIRPFALTSVLGSQHINMTVYEMDEKTLVENSSSSTTTTANSSKDHNSSKGGPHIRRTERTWVQIELSHKQITQLGPSARKVLAMDKESANKKAPVVTTAVTLLQQQEEEPEHNDVVRNGQEEQNDGIRGRREGQNESSSGDRPPMVTDEEEELAIGIANSSASAAAEGQLGVVETILEGPESDEASEEDDAAAELGEGIYVRSGDPIVLREAVSATEESTSLTTSTATAASATAGTATLTSTLSSVVTIGGGFCLLKEQQTPQEQTPSTHRIVIERAKASGRRRRKGTNGTGAGSSLIKNGDTVMFKLINSDTATLYLTIHRGWWLKWVPLVPNKNCYFTIHTHNHDHDDDNIEDDGEYDDPQTSYLTVGGTFWLQHKRWYKYAVGAAADGSPTYGGRLMALYRQDTTDRQATPKSAAGADHSTAAAAALGASVPPDEAADGSFDNEDAGPDTVNAPTEWMKPVLFRASEGPVTCFESSQSNTQRRRRTSLLSNCSDDAGSLLLDDDRSKSALVFSNDDARLDAPVWIELMNRTTRTIHLAFVVRVFPSRPSFKEEEEQELSAFVRIRTGRDSAEVMRAGQNWRNRMMSVSSSSHNNNNNNLRRQKVERTDSFLSSPRSSNHSFHEQRNSSDSAMKKAAAPATSIADDEDDDPGDIKLVEMSLEDSDELDSHDGDFLYNDDDGEAAELSSSEALQFPRRRQRRRQLIGKLARSVKHRTSAVVKAGKGTVTAGKSMIPIRHKNPPIKEPVQKQTLLPIRSRRRTERDLHMALSRRMKRKDWNGSTNANDPDSMEAFSSLAGELSAPEQSRHTVSNMLLRMSCIPRSSEYHTSFNHLLNAQIGFSSNHDQSFLRGNVLDLGVTPNKKNGEVVVASIVARCLWEGHWREEWCALYERTIMFYTPLTDTPSLELSLADIQSFRMLDIGSASPLPGLPILVIETAWQCYYIAFLNDDSRVQFHEKLGDTRATFDRTVSGHQGEQELLKARFWQGFQSSFESSLSGGKGKWAEIVYAKRKKRRVVLNNRRMPFDLGPFHDSPAAFSETLLSWCLSFRLESLLEHPEALERFLDATSQLQKLPLSKLNFMDPETFCIFVNLYHCLLQHALLVSVNGPLTKRSCGHFMRTNCYEIGGDVFSLAELQLCVIRGRMSRPVAPKAPFFDVPRKSQAFQYYALGFTSPLVNFVVNTGNVMSPRQVAVFGVDSFFEQLSAMALACLRKNLVVDESKRTIYIPRVCEVFRGDFTESTTGWMQECLRYCLALLLDQELVSKIENMLQDPSVNLKFQSVSDQYHSTLQALSLPQTYNTRSNEDDQNNDNNPSDQNNDNNPSDQNNDNNPSDQNNDNNPSDQNNDNNPSDQNNDNNTSDQNNDNNTSDQNNDNNTSDAVGNSCNDVEAAEPGGSTEAP